MKVSELIKSNPYVTVLLVGDSGTAKTTWAAKAPMPLFILLDWKSLGAVAEANPDAQIVGTSPVKGLAELARIWAAALISEPVTLENGQPASVLRHGGVEYTYQTLVVDSLNIYYDWLVNRASAMAHESNRLADREKRRNLTAQGGIEPNDMALTQAKWYDMIKGADRFLSDVGRVPANVIALGDVQIEGGRIIPKTEPKSPGASIVRHFAACGYARPGQSGALGIQWAQNRNVLCKPASLNWPSAIPHTKDEAGNCSLGSLALYDAMCRDSDVLVPHNESDSAEYVGKVVDRIARIAQQPKAEISNEL